jgi:hypothetical protein
MRKYIVAILITLIFSLVFWPAAFSKIWGYYSVNLPGDCVVDVFSKSLQPFFTVALACSGKDMIRIWPLPVVDPWFEDWFDWVKKKRLSG